MHPKFKKGDKIRRIINVYGICKVGGIYTFDAYNKQGTALYIKENNGNYDVQYFELALARKQIESDVEWLDRVQENFKE
jgi:hypothetical protein